MPTVAILNDYQRVALTSADWDPVRARAEVVVFDRPFADQEEAMAALAGVDVICLMRERLEVTSGLLDGLPALKCIVTTGAANRAIDLDAARHRGIVVSGTTNGMGRVATAELTWGLILALARRIPRESAAIRAGAWQTSVGMALHGKTLGILGLGGVGRHVARYGRAFGMDVISWSRNLDPERALESQASLVSWDDLLQRSDILTVHVVLSPESAGLIDAAALARMKSTALLVNTSRGPVVSETDLIAALRAGTIAGAALDVFDIEPLPARSALLEFDNVVLTPHLGYVTDDVYADFYLECVRSILAYLDGTPIRVLNGGPDRPGTASERRYEDVG